VLDVDYKVQTQLPPGRLAAIVSYSGQMYRGWQIQKSGVPTVQLALEKALSKIANHPVTTICAGRTDAGVHGSYQVVHFDVSVERAFYSWVMGVNSQLPKDINMLWLGTVPDTFSARFSAIYRRYFYVIYNHPIRPAINYAGLSWFTQHLDEKKMHLAAQSLVGEHDFTSFRASACQSKSPYRNVEHINVTRYDNIVVIDIQANAFLHHMVRNIVGVLMSVGIGESSISWPKEVLLEKDRRVAGVTAKPGGLYLVDVGYSSDFNIPRANPMVPFQIQS
jgi:tRNA pseudouridine38-40 synthase